MSEILTYTPPKSAAFGHDARIRDPKKAWSLAEQFLSVHTVATLRQDVKFQCWAPNEWTDAEAANSCLEAARASFGNEPDDTHTIREWILGKDQIPRAIELLFECSKLPPKNAGRVSLDLCHDFIWREFPKESVDPSFLGIFFSNTKIFLQPYFLFPIAWDDREYAHWLEQITDSAPFRFRDQYFKRGIPTKRDHHYRFLNLPKGWRAAA